MPPEGAPSPPEAFRELLAGAAPRFALPLSSDVLDSLARYLAELDRWRRSMDLTGPLEAQELVDHALESALASRWIPPAARALDIGSGAGFPGVPLAIARPDMGVAALEPREKRVQFLRHVARSVPVANLEVIHGRLETSNRVFDVATVRAVGELGGLVAGATFLHRDGLLLVWTTEPDGLAQELSGSFRLEHVEKVPGSRKRAIAVFRKQESGSRQAKKERAFRVERTV